MTKKIISMVIALALFITLFAACGSKKSTDKESTATPASTVTKVEDDKNADAFTISISSWTLGTDANSNPNSVAYKSKVEELYKVKYPNATLQWDNFAGENYFPVLKAKLASNSAADVFYHQNALIPFSKAGYMVDLSDQPWVADMAAGAIPWVTYEGKTVGAPTDFTGWGLFYSKKVFADLGITADPKNFAEFLAICDTAKAKGIVPITAGFKDGYPAIGTWLSLGHSFVYGANDKWQADRYAGKVKFNSPEWISVFTYLQQMTEKGYFSKSILSTTYDQSLQELCEGKAAMMMMGPWMVDQAMATYKTELGYFNIPDDKGNIRMEGSVGAVISVNAALKERQRGIDLLNNMIGKDGILTLKAGFSPYKSIEIEQVNTGNKEYGLAVVRDPGVPEFNFPASTSTVLQEIVTKICSGAKFDTKDLDEADKSYEKDKDTVPVPDR